MKLRYSSLHRFGADSLVLGSFAAILAARSAIPCELPVMWCLALVVATEALQLTPPSAVTTPQQFVAAAKGLPPSVAALVASGTRVVMLTAALLGLQAVLTLVLPLALGKIRLMDLLTNPCRSYVPGNVQRLGNFGPHYLYPRDCSGLGIPAVASP